MEHTFTLDELAQFTQDEFKLSKELGLTPPTDLPQVLSPSTMVVKNILNYSKALSVRETKRFGKVEMILNWLS